MSRRHMLLQDIAQEQMSEPQDLEEPLPDDRVDMQIEFPDNQLGLPPAEEAEAEPAAGPVGGEDACEKGKLVEEPLQVGMVARPLRRLKKASPFLSVELLSEDEGDESFLDAVLVFNH